MFRALLIFTLLAGLATTAEPAPREVTFPGAEGTLAGTLVVPERRPNPPALILVSGSGPQDRDETVRGLKPFRRIANHLERHGIATLRYDDRGVGGSEGNPDATLAEEAADLTKAIAFLCSTGEVNPTRIGVLGHSMGGVILSLAAAEVQPAFAIMLASPATPGAELLRAQTRRKLELNRVPEARIARNDELIRDIAAATLEGDEALKATVAGLAEQVGGDENWSAEQVAFFGSRMLRSFLSHDMSAYDNLRMPVLALFAEDDWKVDAEADGTALAAHSIPKLTTETLPRHNHLFQQTPEGRPLSSVGPAPSDQTLGWITGWIAGAGPGANPCEAGQ
ncbi:MAG: alpha/beta fold hydrolase [Pseudomonadota bacterium]